MPEDARVAETNEPETNECQRCSTEFDWHRDTCPECGWDKSEWVASGRYGLSKS
jgi:ribosomal protein L37E